VYSVQVLSSVDLTGLLLDSAGHYRALETVGQVEASVTDEVLGPLPKAVVQYSSPSSPGGSAHSGLVPETWPPHAVFLAAAVPGSLVPRFGHLPMRLRHRFLLRFRQLAGACGEEMSSAGSTAASCGPSKSRRTAGTAEQSEELRLRVRGYQRLLSLCLFQDLARELRKRPW